MTTLSVNDSVFRFRAIRSGHVPLEQDPEPMIQQQYARLQFFDRQLGAAGCRVLDWGCGSGFNCDWLKRTGRAREVAGFDLSADAVTLARKACPGIPFYVADACAPDLDLG